MGSCDCGDQSQLLSSNTSNLSKVVCYFLNLWGSNPIQHCRLLPHLKYKQPDQIPLICLHRKFLPCLCSQRVLLIPAASYETFCALTAGLSFPDTLHFPSTSTGQSLCSQVPPGHYGRRKTSLLLSKLLMCPASSCSPFPGQASSVLLACHINWSSPTACSRQLSPMSKLFKLCQPVPSSC